MRHGWNALRHNEPVQQGAQALAFGRMNRLDPGHFPFQMLPVMRMPVAVLRFQAVAEAVGERGFQAVEIRAPDIGLSIDDESGQMLPHRWTHQAGLAMVHLEAFFQENGRGVDRKAPSEFAAGECQIVRVARVSGSHGHCQAG